MPSGISGGQQGQMPEMPGGMNYDPIGADNDTFTFTVPVGTDTYPTSNTSVAVSGHGTYYSADTTPSGSPAEVSAEDIKLTKEQEAAGQRTRRIS